MCEAVGTSGEGHLGIQLEARLESKNGADATVRLFWNLPVESGDVDLRLGQVLSLSLSFSLSLSLCVHSYIYTYMRWVGGVCVGHVCVYVYEFTHMYRERERVCVCV